MKLRTLTENARRKLRRSRRQPQVKPLVSNDVWVLVLNWNRADETSACLESLLQSKLDGARILVVDNGSKDGSAALVRERFPGVVVLELPENRGYAGGNNAGIRFALRHGAGAVLLLNNDTQVAEDFLPPLLDVLNRDPWIGAVSSAILRADSPDVLDAAYLTIYFGHGIVRHFGCNALPGEGFDVVRLIDVAIGCAVLVRAETFRRVGLLDESYFAYHEEVDWCHRVHRAGLDIAYQPFSRVWHRGSRSTQQLVKQRRSRRGTPRGEQLPNRVPLPWNPVRTYLGSRNAIRFLRLHAGPLRKLKFAASFARGVPLELLAVLLDREEEWKMGQLGFRQALWLYCQEGASSADGAPAGERLAAAAAWERASSLARVKWLTLAPMVLLKRLPADLRRARAEGATEQVEACLRGTWDGILDRPLPLEELGLR